MIGHGHLDQALVVAAAVGSRPGAQSTSGWAGSLRNYQNYPGDHLGHWGKGDVQHQKQHQEHSTFHQLQVCAYNGNQTQVYLILDFFHSPWFRYHLAVIGVVDNPSEAIPRP